MTECRSIEENVLGVLIEHEDADLCLTVDDGNIMLWIGEDQTGLLSIGYLRYLEFSLSRDEAINLRDGLNGLIDLLG